MLGAPVGQVVARVVAAVAGAVHHTDLGAVAGVVSGLPVRADHQAGVVDIAGRVAGVHQVDHAAPGKPMLGKPHRALAGAAVGEGVAVER